MILNKILTLKNGLTCSKLRQIAMIKMKMISVSLLFKYLLNIDHQTFLWKVKMKHISKLFNVITAWLCLGYFF